MDTSFIEFYNSIVKEFSKENLFTEINCTNETILWPNSTGVYTIWHNNTISINDLIYIGMTGSYKRSLEGNVVLNNGLFSNRVKRWTPYRFCEEKGNYQFHFRYGPAHSNTKAQGKIQKEDNAYLHSIPYTNIKIHCFIIDHNHPLYTPSLLESLLLTKYLKDTNTLPIANNKL